ncbi:MAG: hypothetical protein ABIQ64_03060 [Candidatus Saccharimonadales bacterium]
MRDQRGSVDTNHDAQRRTPSSIITSLTSSLGRVATRGQFILQHNLKKADTSIFITSLRDIAQSRRNRQDDDDIEDMINRSNEVLVKATTVFPLTPFPDTVILDRTKLTVIRRNFFFSEDVMSIRIEDILNVSANIGPFFGSITIATRVMSTDDHFTIYNFLREDVMHLKHMIHGYVIARHNNIPCDHLTHEQLVHTLQELGHEKHR